MKSFRPHLISWLIVAALSVSALPPNRAWAGCDLGRQLDQIIQEGQFNTARGLRHYFEEFGYAFEEDLYKLKRGDQWLDAGSGESYAIRDFATGYDNWPVHPRDRARVVGVTYEKKYPFKSTPPPERFKVLSGRFFEEIPHREIGKSKLITDYYGVLVYTKSPDVALQGYLDLLTPDGVIYLSYGHRAELDRTLIFLPDGRALTFKQWLMQIPGIKVTAHPRSAGASDGSTGVILRITKAKGAQVRVPRLKLTEPPSRPPNDPVPSRLFEQEAGSVPSGGPEASAVPEEPQKKPGILKRLFRR